MPIVIRPREYTKSEKVYLIEIMRGLYVTMSHFLRNIIGVFTRKRVITSWEYPEEHRPYNPRNRLLHRLLKRPDGSPKCVACYMCATACPAGVIEIIAEESPDPKIEKRPISFVIDELRCVYCGFCVDACPKDAIRMDSDIGNLVGATREEFVLNMRQLMSISPQDNAIPYDREIQAQKDAGLFDAPPATH
jgi:NADH-quinone oxidoreductase subunit I